MDEYSLSKRQEPNVISGFEEDISSQCVPGTIGSSSPQDITDHEHLRKLKHENSSLTNENKLLKEKYNRATTRLQELEDLVVNLQQHLDQLLEDHSSELSSLRKKLRQEFEIERNDLNKKIHLLNQDNEQLGIELSSAKKQLEELHKVAQDSNILSEKESMITALKAEVHAYKDQLKKTENLYKESETHYHEELDRRKALASQVNKLTEMKNLLQQKVDERSEDTINEKQIKSLERRLKVTEDRLHLERADNGNKLSDVEEKLINENAKLQVQGKEFKRKWDREKSRAKHQELRVNELRDENEAMVISLANSPPSCYNAITEDGVIKRGRISLIIPEFKKNSSEFKDVMRQVEREEGLKAGQEAEIIHCLFYKKDEACKMLKNWEVQLHSLGLDRDNLSQGLKRLREEKHENDTKMQQREDEMEDLKMKSDEMENRLRGQISELVKEKHLVYAKLKTMEDRYAGMLSEMEVLRLSTSIGVQSCNLQRDYAAEAEIEKLKSELVTAQNESQQCTRSTKMMEGQLKAVKAELNAKAKELEIVSHKLHDAISEISTHSNEISNKHQDHVEKLYAQMRSSQGEVSFWQEKSFHLNAEKDELEEKIANLTRQIGFNQSKLQHEGRNMHTYELQKQGLERELAGKESQLLELTVKYNDLEDNLFHTRQNLLCEQDNSTKLATEVENLQIQLKLKNDLVDRFNGSDNDYGQGLQNMQQNLEAVHNELIEKTAEITAQECVSFKQQKESLSLDLQRRDTDMNDLIKQYENDACRADIDKDEWYKNLSAAGKKVAVELEATKKLCDAKDQELLARQESISRQKVELESALKRSDLLREDNVKCREDMEKMNKEIAIKINEQSSSFETNRSLLADKSQLQMEKYQLQKDLDKEKEILAIKTNEISELHKKVDHIENQIRNVEKECHQKDNQLVVMETEHKHLKKSMCFLETERDHLRQQVISINEDVRKLTIHDNAIQKQLDLEQSMIHDEKVSRQKAQDDLVAVSKQFDNLKADYDVLCVSLEYEKNSAYKIKEHSDSVLKEHQNSLQELKKLQDELESCKTELNANIDMIVILKRDKESSYRDLQMMCHKLDEKDQTIITLQEKCSIAVESIQREYAVERTNLSNDIETKQSELQTTREKLVQITEQFKEKEIQLAGFGKTLRVLDEETRMRHDLELKYQSVNSELLDAKMLMGHMKTENVSLKEAARQLQDNMDKLKENNTSLREKLKDQHEKINQENHDLKNSIFKTNEQYDKERNDLKSRLNKALSSLKSAEASLSASNSSREQLLNNCRSSEQNLDELKGQLHEEITNRKLAEQLLSNMKVHLDDSIGQKNQYDDRLSVTQAMLMKKEGDLAVEQEKYQKLTLDFNELEATSYAQEARAQTLQEQVNGLEFENLNYRNTVESLKHNFTGKTKKQLEDMRQDVQSLEQERNKLMYQLQLLESDFMKAREQISQKNQEILNLKEENLVQDERLKDAKNKLREIKDARKLEEAVQGKLHLRNQELEKDIVSLRSNKGDMVDGSSIDSKSDVRDMLKELNRQVAEHNENRQRLELEYKQKLANLTKQYDSKINALELRLFSENAMHNVTKNQVNSLEEDLQRLRCKLLNKKRENTDKSKDVSRIEEINELIAKSQVRAQAMLSNSFALDETSLNNLRFSPMVGTPTALSPAFATSTPRVPSVNSMFRPIDSNK
ncbi:uncharacterized protein LOC141905831 isoform X2 [Tubulanus polymorphus]|uniref:uncharacterized protein LOC141905831 isoform X2 n=1 Tax=Tubulanus polymorphus TaxID=672921 RepID=UPI003DA4C646